MGMFNLIIYELDQGNIDRSGPEVLFLRCLECENASKIDVVKHGKVVNCPVCETDYVTALKNEKAQLKEFMYGNDDFGELLYRDVAT